MLVQHRYVFAVHAHKIKWLVQNCHNMFLNLCNDGWFMGCKSTHMQPGFCEAKLRLRTLWVSGNSQLCAVACFCSDPLHLHQLHTELITLLFLNMETWIKKWDTKKEKWDNYNQKTLLWFLTEGQIFLSLKCPDLTLGSAQPTMHQVTVVLSSGIKQPWCKVVHWPSSAEVALCTPICLCDVQRHNFKFTSIH